MKTVLQFPAPEAGKTPAPIPAPAFTELIATSNFSFLHGGSHPQELVSAAIHLGLNGMGLCDRNSFAGVVRAHVIVREAESVPPGFHYCVGVRLCFVDGTPDIVAYPTDRIAYGRLCKLLTRANMKGEKGRPELIFDELFAATDPEAENQQGPIEDFSRGQLFIVIPDETDWIGTEKTIDRLSRHAPGNVWIAGIARYAGNDRARLNRIAELGRRHRAPMLASNDVLYHEPDRRMVQDVVTCIREHLTLETAGKRLGANAERHLKPAGEMARLFAEHPEAIRQTQILADRIDFSLDQLQYNYPEETVGNGESAQQTLERLTWEGAAKRFPEGLTDALKRTIWAELCLIAYKGYAAYFLTVRDIVQFARYEKGILCQGRGSAANSTVCFCLEITEVNPEDASLVFGRFISTERDEPPDIDVDFEHERREEVMQYVYQKYGGKHTGLTANVICYRSKSAIRETAKAFGISDDIIDAINQMHWSWGQKFNLGEVAPLGLNPDDPVLAQMFEVVKVLRGFPRHLSQHVGGFVITRDSLESMVPIGKSAMENRAIIEWNKDDIDALRILKVDVLALGMLTCLKRAFDLMQTHYHQTIELAALLHDEKHDPEGAAPVYRMTHRADTIGVFQIESRAQMSMLPRLKPEKFYDLVIEVAIVRPGPIQGGMVHPYLQRRMNNEVPDYPSEALREVLHRTLGVPLFQEQAMQIAVKGAGFSPGKADQLRRAMATWQHTGKVKELKKDFIDGMLANHYPLDYAERCFKQIEGFGEYGFPESHAASFALLVYASCWLKCHYPDVFAAALLNSQPMGFYAPSQIIRDAREHGIEVRPVDINRSDIDHTLEATERCPADHIWPRHAEMREQIWSKRALRLGLRAVPGFNKKAQETIVACRGGGYISVRDVWLRTGLSIAQLEKLAEADGFGSLGLTRRDALWAVRGLIGTHGADTLPLFEAAGPASSGPETPADLPTPLPGENVMHDYSSLTFSLKGHPVQFIRPQLAARGIVPAHGLSDVKPGRMVEVAGLVLVRQRPGTASGVIFVTLEDETGIANVVVWSRVFDRYRRTLLSARMLSIRGQLQREGRVIHVIAKDMTDLTPYLLDLAAGREPGLAEGHDPQTRRQIESARREAYAALPSGRNFH